MLILRQNAYMDEIELSQRTKKYKMCCSIFAPNINLNYNTNRTTSLVIVDKQVDIAVSEWTLDLVRGWAYAKNFDIVARMNLANSLKFKKTDAVFSELLEKWYAIQCYFYANKAFTDTIKDDWVIEFEDWEQYEGRSYAHTWNIYSINDVSIWKRRYFIQDSVFVQVDWKDIEITDIEGYKKFIGNSCFAFL